MRTAALGWILLLVSCLPGRSQGTITFVNRSGSVQSPIYGPELDFVNFGGDWANAKTGNTATGVPSGTQVYGGVRLESFLVTFWAAPGSVTDGHLLLPGSGSAVLGTGSLAGYFPTTSVTFSNLPASGAATVQVRITDPSGFLILSPEGNFAGASALFSADIGATATGLRSFSAGWLDPVTFAPYVPEPAVFGLIALAAGIAGTRQWWQHKTR